MDAGLTPEQTLLAEISAALAAQLAGSWQVGRSPDTADSCVPEKKDWQRIADAGWLGLRADPDPTVAGSCLDVCLVVEQLGRHAVPAPVIGTILLIEQLRLRGAPPELMASLASGQTRMAPVLTHDLRGFAVAVPGIALDAAGAPEAAIAADKLYLCKMSDSLAGPDLTRALASVGEAEPRSSVALTVPEADSVHSLTTFALTLVSADLLGVMRGAFDHALAHAKTREQFSVPIGSFQAIQHIAAECHVSIEATRSAVWYAAWAADELPADEAMRAARTAKAFAAASAIDVVEACVQILGGIGMTWESPAHVWQRRAQLDRMLFGDEAHQRRQLAST